MPNAYHDTNTPAIRNSLLGLAILSGLCCLGFAYLLKIYDEKLNFFFGASIALPGIMSIFCFFIWASLLVSRHYSVDRS